MFFYWCLELVFENPYIVQARKDAPYREGAIRLMHTAKKRDMEKEMRFMDFARVTQLYRTFRSNFVK